MNNKTFLFGGLLLLAAIFAGCINNNTTSGVLAKKIQSQYQNQLEKCTYLSYDSSNGFTNYACGLNGTKSTLLIECFIYGDGDYCLARGTADKVTGTPAATPTPLSTPVVVTPKPSRVNGTVWTCSPNGTNCTQTEGPAWMPPIAINVTNKK